MMDILSAIKDRKSVRKFLEKPVDPQTIKNILNTAAWAPSGVNTQPWHVAVVGEKSIQKIGDGIIHARQKKCKEHPEYSYYAGEWVEPYKSRRVDCGKALYGAMNIQREDKEKRQELWDQNYYFFGAPVGLVVYLEKTLATGSYMDCGMFIQNIMLAAREFGLETCPQASLADYPTILKPVLNIPDEYVILCGIALGYEDKDAAINNYRTSREDEATFSTWFD